MLIVADPSKVGTIFREKPVLESMGALPEELDYVGLDCGDILGGARSVARNRRFPDIALWPRIVAEQVLDISAYEGGRKISCSLVAVDHRGRGGQQMSNAVLGSDESFADILARGDVAQEPTTSIGSPAALRTKCSSSPIQQ